ncbi:uncharacterized protein LOC133424243 [Cololabis saira]|uniref:uncharacterized protein LOC133424243 n=1 Tax=Cololabis saira TaxID=129043 RepID=UPI002AD45EEF|nr:uncharacterized protein LOC133424243 [Cololabis saira]
MEVFGTTKKRSDPSLPLSSLRLLVPPLQLLSAAMWQLAKQKDVMNYEKLQEFVTLVTEAVPGLINHRQRAQLVLGLRARLILELCKGSPRGDVDSQMIQSYLERLPVTIANTDCMDAEVKTTETTFIALVRSLLKDPVERAYFFQEVFPVEYGPQYDTALHVLMWELLTKLEKLLPVPDLKQTAAWITSAASAFDERVQLSPEELSLIFKHYKSSGLLKTTYGPSSTIGSCIMSALSVPPSQKTSIQMGLESIHNYANTPNPVTLSGTDQYSVVAIYTEVEVRAAEVGEDTREPAEVQLQTGFYEEEIVTGSAENTGSEECTALRTEETGEHVGVAKALETLTKTFALKKDSRGQDEITANCNDPPPCGEFGSGNGPDEGQTSETSDQSEGKREGVVQDSPPETTETTDSSAEAEDNCESISVKEITNVSSEAGTEQSDSSANVRRSSRNQTKTSVGQEICQVKETARETSKETQMYKKHLECSFLKSF